MKKMKISQLTAREVILIFILIELCVNYVGLFGYKYLNNTIKEIEANTELVEEQKRLDDLLVMRSEELKNNYLEEARNLKKMQENFLNLKDTTAVSEYVDQNLLNLIVVNKMSVSELNSSIQGLKAYQIDVNTNSNVNKVFETIKVISESPYLIDLNNFEINTEKSTITFTVYAN